MEIKFAKDCIQLMFRNGNLALHKVEHPDAPPSLSIACNMPMFEVPADEVQESIEVIRNIGFFMRNCGNGAY